MVETGFLVSEDSFIWTRRGLLKINELKSEDQLLGIVAGKPLWSSVSDIKKSSRDRLVRITTDGNEVLVSEDCEVFTISGIKKASDVSEGEILETFNIPQETKELMDAKSPSLVESEIGPIKIDSKIAYILGTQIRSRKFENKVVIQGLHPDHAYEVARICSEALREQFVRHKIYYVAGGKKVRIDCAALAEVCLGITEDNIPRFVRESHATALRYFLCGVLDVILYTSKFEDPPTFFITFARQSEFRRFILNALRLFGVSPAKTYVFHPTHGVTYMKTYINPQDLRQLGLKFVRTKETPKAEISQKGKPISYSTIRDLTKFRGKTFFLKEPQLHWSPIVDLAPLHRHILP